MNLINNSLPDRLRVKDVWHRLPVGALIIIGLHIGKEQVLAKIDHYYAVLIDDLCRSEHPPSNPHRYTSFGYCHVNDYTTERHLRFVRGGK